MESNEWQRPTRLNASREGVSETKYIVLSDPSRFPIKFDRLNLDERTGRIGGVNSRQVCSAKRLAVNVISWRTFSEVRAAIFVSDIQRDAKYAGATRHNSRVTRVYPVRERI